MSVFVEMGRGRPQDSYLVNMSELAYKTILKIQLCWGNMIQLQMKCQASFIRESLFSYTD